MWSPGDSGLTCLVPLLHIGSTVSTRVDGVARSKFKPFRSSRRRVRLSTYVVRGGLMANDSEGRHAEETASWHTQPLAMVDSLWDGSADSTISAVQSQVASAIEAEEVPLMTVAAYHRGDFAPRSLARWVGMVQDIGNSEFYVPVVGEQCAMFRDWVAGEACLDIESSQRLLSQRSVIYGIATPGQSDWARERLMASSIPLRMRTAPEQVCRSSASKRHRSDEADDGDEPDRTMWSTMNRSSEVKEGPLLGERLKAPHEVVDCLVRIYGDEEPKLHDLIEVIGIVGSDGSLPPAEDEAEVTDDIHAAWAPPLSKAARLHALRWRVLESWYPLHKPLPAPVADGDETWASARRLLLDYLTSALYGDATTAEYILLALIARPIGRSPDRERAVGAMAVDLIVKDKLRVPIARRLADAIAPLVPRCALIRASEALPPLRESERLVATKLQLAEGTIVVFDFNLKAMPYHLQNFIADPKVVECDFGMGHYATLPIDAPTIVVTQDRRGTVADCQLAPHFAVHDSPLPPLDEINDQIRCYLAAARHTDVDLDDQLAQRLQDDFVQARAERRIPGSEADKRLSLWLTLCRLDAKSRGHGLATLHHWDHCAKLERFRVARYDNLKRAAGI